MNIYTQDIQHLATIEDLTSQLEVYKQAFADAKSERYQHEKFKEEAKREREQLESKLKVN